MDSIQDDFFGLLEWDEQFQEWNGGISIAPHGDVSVQLPVEYPDSNELREHIRKTIAIIRRDELSFREKAAAELFAKGGYVLFLDENEPFDHARFVNQMHLVCITFEPDFPAHPLILSYEYGEEGMEHGIVLHLTWDAEYQDTREG